MLRKSGAYWEARISDCQALRCSQAYCAFQKRPPCRPSVLVFLPQPSTQARKLNRLLHRILSYFDEKVDGAVIGVVDVVGDLVTGSSRVLVRDSPGQAHCRFSLISINKHPEEICCDS
jgi:hypothetical protein